MRNKTSQDRYDFSPRPVSKVERFVDAAIFLLLLIFFAGGMGALLWRLLF
jgi:hypothetical protein